MPMSKEDKEKIGSLSQSEITEKIKKGELTIPASDKNEFFNFVAKTPEERLKEISGEVSQPEPPAEPAPSTPDVSKDGKGEAISSTPAPDKKGPWWKEEFGYDSEDKVKETHKSLLENVSRLQAQVDQLNAKGGKTGQDLKRLKDLNASLEAKVAELSKKPEIKKPERPKRPKLSDYEDGALDENYIKDTEKWADDMEAYEEQRYQYEEHTRRREIETVKEDFKKVAPPVAPPEGVSDMDKLFDHDIPEFQKRMGLTTNVSVRAMNDAVLKSKSKDIAVATEAKVFLNSLPPSDVQAFNKINQAVAVAYDGLSEGAPKLKYRSIEGALFDNNLLGDGKPFSYVKQTQLSPEDERAMFEKKRKENEQSVPATSAASAMGSDVPPSSGTTKEEKVKRYKDLIDSYNLALNRGPQARDQFESTPEFEEFKKLKFELFNRR